jgi:hypothetical protein
MATFIKPDLETRIAKLARRLGFDGPDAAEKVLDMALEYLADSTSEEKRYFARESTDAGWQRYTHNLARQGYDSDEEQPELGDVGHKPGVSK